MVFYQIYPLSFKDSNGDGKGDLRGIIEKLDYLDHSGAGGAGASSKNGGGKNSLGVDGIWLCPFYKSPMRDMGYDISDFRAIDPIFGNMDDFEKLVEEVHRRGMKIIIDFVANHTSNEHPWFLESKENRVNEKRDWYVWKDPKPSVGPPEESPPNNWLSVFGGPAWTFDKATEQFYLHNFLPEQPDLNWRNSEVINAMMSVMNYWVGRGVDGFRVDAMHHFIEDEKMRDDPPNPNFIPGQQNPYRALRHIYSKGDTDFRAGGSFFTDFLDKNPTSFVVSEAYASVEEIMKMYLAVPSKNYMPFNFNLATMSWGAENYKKFVDEYESQLRPHRESNYILGNHDISRVASRLDPLRARLSAFLQFTLRGTPFIYYGEELGMENVPISDDQIQDQAEKNLPKMGLGRDPERTPMLWDDSANAGFSSGGTEENKPRLPVSPNYKSLNVAAQLANPHSMLSLYRTLIHLRRSSQALSNGSYVPRESESKSVFSFIREYVGDMRGGAEKLLLLANFGEAEVVEKIEDIKNSSRQNGQLEIICNSALDRVGEKIDSDGQNGNQIKLRPFEACLIRM